MIFSEYISAVYISEIKCLSGKNAGGVNGDMIEPQISIIVPAFNVGNLINSLVEMAERVQVSVELLLINDGSSDDTAELCREAEEKYSFVRFIDKPHTGVSDTRNVGIKKARGKYILFLDADDSITDGSVDGLYEFFEQCGDVCDLVTYPIETHYHGRILAPHFRYKYLTYSGIYDLNELPYIGQTTMNIMVRNRFADNVLFDSAMTFSEDQKYCFEVTRKKLKIGFFAGAKYIYYRGETTSSGRISGACYIFEQSMKMFEDMFSGYQVVPAAFQGLYINDLAWKLRSNILYPYHYGEKEFSDAENRIRALLSRVDNSVIVGHPDINFFHKYYWLSQKPGSGVSAFFSSEGFGLKDKSGVLISQNNIEIVVTRIRNDSGTFVFRGFLKSVVFNFSEQPRLYAQVNGSRQEQVLYDSAHSYYICRTRTHNFYAFCFEAQLARLQRLSFVMQLGGYEYRCKYYFMPKTPFVHSIGRYKAPLGGRTLEFDREKGTFELAAEGCGDVLVSNSRNQELSFEMKRLRRRAARLKYQTDICLYYDCRGVGRDNGWYRFREDYEKGGGVRRVYIYDGEKARADFSFPRLDRRDLVPFGSEEHKLLCLACRRIVTAYIEDINIFPFPSEELYLYSDFFDFEVEYIQHGILHASLPWKYTPEIIIADKVTVSTDYEEKLFVEKYHFRKEDIIPGLMPRLKRLDQSVKPQRKILFAPSWRQYLIGPDIEGKWQPLKELFEASDYFRNISDFLNGEKLRRLLEQNDYILDFKLHPIFEVYRGCFEIRAERVRMVDSPFPIEQYEMFITDFSSFVFDFIYLGRKVFSFIPDEMQFRCGMNSYREVEGLSEAFLEKIGAENVEKIFEKKNADFCLSFIAP